jgi:hypothetical protein
MGAHVLRAGVARHLIDLMERGLLNHIAMNGAGPSSTALFLTRTSASWPRPFGWGFR